MARSLRWYRLRSGVPWSCYGPPPAGAVEVSEQEASAAAAEQLVAAAKGGSPVGSDVEGVDAVPEADQVGSAPGDGAAVDEDTDGDGDVVGHDGGS